MATSYDESGIGPRRKALMDSLGGNTGISGFMPGGAATPPIQSATPTQQPSPGFAEAMSSMVGGLGAKQPAAPAYSGDFSRLAGYDQGKFDANKQDAKYQIGRTLAQFDPRQGVTPEVLAGLNQLGYGTFAGQGDKLSLSGLTDKGRQNKLSGDYSNADFIQGFHGGNGKWGYADPAAEAQQAPQGGGMGGISPMLQGDPTNNIGAALANIGQLAQPSRLQQLIAALGGQG